ncbi:MAG: hypothetical protein P8N43_00650 [Alphaproteobacteria bacterium]|nr:hypothetical protein [Alphaproteobacteria bacterium]
MRLRDSLKTCVALLVGAVVILPGTGVQASVHLTFEARECLEVFQKYGYANWRNGWGGPSSLDEEFCNTLVDSTSSRQVFDSEMSEKALYQVGD